MFIYLFIYYAACPLPAHARWHPKKKQKRKEQKEKKASYASFVFWMEYYSSQYYSSLWLVFCGKKEIKIK